MKKRKRPLSKRYIARRDAELIVMMSLIEGAWRRAVHLLVTAHSEEFNRYYKKARAAFEPAEKSILRRIEGKRR